MTSSKSFFYDVYYFQSVFFDFIKSCALTVKVSFAILLRVHARFKRGFQPYANNASNAGSKTRL